MKKWTLTNFLDNDEEIKRHFESYEDAHMEQQWTGGRLEFLEVEGEEKKLFNETLGTAYTGSKKMLITFIYKKHIMFLQNS